VNHHTGDNAVFIESPGDFLDFIHSAAADTFVLNRKQLAPTFFDLKTGLAGEILQKCSNYRRRLVILGDFTLEKSKSMQDFIRESNKTGKVVFAATLPEAENLLR
jgi:hypothetical protein